jgi:hypothetical protein
MKSSTDSLLVLDEAPNHRQNSSQEVYIVTPFPVRSTNLPALEGRLESRWYWIHVQI